MTKAVPAGGVRFSLALLSALALSGCIAMYPAYPVAPPPREELVPAPPRSSVPLIWQPGHYDWDGTRYSWVPGRWVSRAGHGTLWQDGYWRREGSAYIWVPAHWI